MQNLQRVLLTHSYIRLHPLVARQLSTSSNPPTNPSPSSSDELKGQGINPSSIEPAELLNTLRSFSFEFNGGIIIEKTQAANKLNQMEQQVARFLKTSTDQSLNFNIILSLLQTSLQHHSISKSIISLSESNLLEFFAISSNSTSTFLTKLPQLHSLLTVIANSTKFSYEFIQKLHELFLSSYDENNALSLDILLQFFAKGFTQLPDVLPAIPTHSLQALVNGLWIRAFQPTKIVIQPEVAEALLHLLQEQVRQLQPTYPRIQFLLLLFSIQPSLKSIAKSTQYKLKEIALKSEGLGSANDQLIKQFDEFVSTHSHSIIQEDCEIILSVMKLKYTMEAVIDPYTVDFLVEVAPNKPKCVIEMNGPTHYPFVDRHDILTAKDQLKVQNLTNAGYKVISIHHAQWSKIKGVTAKIDFMRQQLHEAAK